MKKSLWIGILLVAVIALATVVWKQNERITRANERLAVLAADKEKSPASPPPRTPRPEPLPAPPPAEPAATQAPAPEPTPIPAAPFGQGAGSNFMAGIASMMKSPAMKEMVRTQQKMQTEKMYRSLPKYLNLSTDQTEALNRLLLDRQMAMIDAGFAAMSGPATERTQAVEDTKAVKAEYDQEIQDLLGPVDYQMFQQYEQSVAERMQVSMFKAELPGDAAMTDQQEESLIAAMAEERKAFPATSALNGRSADPSKFTEQNVNEMLQQLDQLQQRYASRAAAILEPAQLEHFTKWQQQWSAMQAMGVKMAAQMFGNKSAAAPTAAGNPGAIP